jgi:hypothetical protein
MRGRLFVWGIAFDLETGGLALVKLALGFLAVAIMGATVAWGRHARAVYRQLTAKTLLTIFRKE